jgi:hypothetical protein
MTTAWHIPPAIPGPLPFAARDADGNTWTDLDSNAEAREACGYVQAPDPPAFDPTKQRLEWVDGAWAVVSMTPDTCTMLQLELELASRNLTDQVTAAVTAVGGDAPIYWRRETDVHRDHPMLLAIQQHLGWSDELLDQIASGASVRS